MLTRSNKIESANDTTCKFFESYEKDLSTSRAHHEIYSTNRFQVAHFDVLCDLLLNRRTATWNLFVLYNKKLKKRFNDDVIYTSVICIRARLVTSVFRRLLDTFYFLVSLKGSKFKKEKNSTPTSSSV